MNTKMPDRYITDNFLRIWESVKLYNNLDFHNNAVSELQEYFGYSKENVASRLRSGEDDFANEWDRHFIHKNKTEVEIIRFYDKTENEIFGLMEWHYVRYKEGPLQYVCSLEIGEKNNYKHYLDYGSGVGTGGILFAKFGYNVTLADISSSNLNFVKFRFNKRKLKANFIDLKHQDIESDRYDMITCFDVLEHAWDPKKTLLALIKALKKDGVLIINLPFHEDKERPMHIVRRKNLRSEIRSLGLDYDWRLSCAITDRIHRATYVLKKTKRNILLNKGYLFYDALPLKLRKRITSIYKFIRNGKS